MSNDPAPDWRLSGAPRTGMHGVRLENQLQSRSMRQVSFCSTRLSMILSTY